MRFNGVATNADESRLTAQFGRIFSLMCDAGWRTLDEIAERTGDPTPSISAQLRHMRKARFGGHVVERRHIANGLYEYRLIVNESRAYA